MGFYKVGGRIRLPPGVPPGRSTRARAPTKKKTNVLLNMHEQPSNKRGGDPERGLNR